MRHNTRRQHHEQSRKEHRRHLQQHAREVAKRPPSTFPRWFLAVGLACILTFLIMTALR